MLKFSMENGLTAAELFSQPYGWTFDDINLLPVFNPGVTKSEVSLQTRFGSLWLNLPLVSSPMDTVTEAATAIEFALQGGLGFIHMNLPVEKATAEVRRVKRYQMGIVNEPVCRPPTASIREMAAVKKQHGFSTLLITADGTNNSPLLGMVTKGHAALESNPDRPLGEIMIPRRDLIVGEAEKISTWKAALEFLRSNPVVHKLPLLRSNGCVAGFITRKDVVKMANCPHAFIDMNNGQLRVGAAVSTHERDNERVQALLDAKVDVLLIDSAQGATLHAVQRIEQIRSLSEKVVIVAGSVVTPAQAEPLLKAGADVLRDGMGSGSICITQDVIGTGRSQLSAIYHVSQRTKNAVIADGGIRTSGDIIKALACGASCVMLGRMIAGCDETPARVETHRGLRYKRYRGMGSQAALEQGGLLRYSSELSHSGMVVQGVEGLVPAEGSLAPLLSRQAEAIKTGLEYLGCGSIAELHQKTKDGLIRFELRSPSARIEGKPHDIVEM